MAKRALFIDGRKVFRDGRAVTVTVGSEGDCDCCGGTTCTIASDDFNRADSSDINVGAPFTWSGDTTDAIIVSNELVLFSGTDQQLTCPTAHPDGSSSGVVSAVFRADTDDECRVWLGADANNCIVAQVVIGSSKTLKIIQRSGGTDTVLESTTCSTSAGGSIGLTLYYDEATGTAKAVAVATELCAFLIDPIGDISGIALGSNAGAVYVDDFLYQRLGDGENGCPELEGCGFDPCFTTIDSGWEGVLAISGMANNVCSGCAFFNDTFILPLTSNGTNEKVFQNFAFTEASVCGTTAWTITLWIEVTCLAEDSFRIEVFIQIEKDGFPEQGVWQYTFSTPPDLFETYPSTLFTTVFLSGSGNWCNFSGVTFTVSFNPP